MRPARSEWQSVRKAYDQAQHLMICSSVLQGQFAQFASAYSSDTHLWVDQYLDASTLVHLM